VTDALGLLHLSHTDIRYDARILRQLEALQSIPGVRVSAIGVELDEDAAMGCNSTRLCVDTVRLRSKRFSYLPRALRYALNLFELMWRVLPMATSRRPSVIHCHDTLMLPLGALVGLVVGSALVYDAHELECHKAGQTRLLSWATSLLERMCWSRITLFVSVSPAIIDWYMQRYGPRRSILVLNTPTVTQPSTAVADRMSQSVPGSRYFHERFGLQTEAMVFVYVGLLVPGRGIENLLEVFSRAGVRSHLVFIGYGDRVGIAEWAHRHENIHLHPAVPHERVVPLISEADCGLCLIEDVSLSDRLCLPNKLFEYALAGLPVLASRLPEIERVVNEYGLGVCCDNDIDSIEKAVRAIERGGIRRPQVDMSELFWETQAERLRHAYLEALSARGLLQDVAGERRS